MLRDDDKIMSWMRKNIDWTIRDVIEVCNDVLKVCYADIVNAKRFFQKWSPPVYRINFSTSTPISASLNVIHDDGSGFGSAMGELFLPFFFRTNFQGNVSDACPIDELMIEVGF